MTAYAVAMPPLEIVSAALRKTTEHLARELVQSGDSPPRWSELEWAIARCAAAMHGISVLLANRLQWSGPPLWQGFLVEQRRQSVQRHARIGELLERIDAATRARAVSCIGLKGAALRELDLYAPGERPMGDVDLLVAARDLPAVVAVMADLGYVEAFTSHRHVVYEPRHKAPLHCFGEHVDNALKIEIHTAVAEELPVDNVDITERLQSRHARPGLNHYPDRVSLLLHLLLHTAGNIRDRSVRRIQLHDIAAVGQLLEAGDWELLLAKLHDTRELWWALPPLELTVRYEPASIPSEVLRAARASCPRLLRLATKRQALTDVSWSNMRITAFPGIAWSRTPLDAVRYVRSRVLPSRHALREIESGRQAQPHLDQVPWYGLSHGHRILRWLFARPPRVHTIISLRAALESAGLPAAEAVD